VATRRLLRRATPLENASARDALTAIRLAYRIDRRIELLAVDGIKTPAATGLVRWRVLVPEALVDSLTPPEWHALLAHEVAHLRRWDLPVAVLGQVALAVHWFNPLVWLALDRLGRDREVACDATAVQTYGVERRLEYGRELISVLQRCTHGRDPHLLAAPMGGRAKSELTRRITAIADRPAPRWLGLFCAAWLGVAACTTLTDPIESGSDLSGLADEEALSEREDLGTGADGADSEALQGAALLGGLSSTDSLDGWEMSGGGRADYEGRAEELDGSPTLRIDHAVESPSGYATLVQSVSAARLRGHRLEVIASFRGRLETPAKDPTARIDMWTRVQGVDSPSDGKGLGGGFCTRDHRTANGAGWHLCRAVFDVPAEGEHLQVGFGMMGRGTVWLRDLTVRVVADDEPLSRGGPAELQNGGLEDGDTTPSGWFMSGGGRTTYDIALDRSERRSGEASARLQRRPDSESYGTLMQNIEAGRYLGQRMRMTAHVKGAGITARGDFWLRVQAPDSPGDGPGLGGGRCKLSGTFDWEPCVVEFEVPEEGTAIQYGIGLAGPGTIWLDDVTLEPIDADSAR